MKEQGRILSFWFLIWIAAIAALIPIAYAGWSEVYRTFLEKRAPQIEVVEYPRGLGVSPVSMTLRLTDWGAGLDEIVVRANQHSYSQELFRQKLSGKTETEVEIPLNLDRQLLNPGEVELDVRVFDQSFWNNRAEESYPLKVDFEKPNLDLISTQHNIRQGGSQLVFYKAYDSDLGVSGVRVGSRRFLGFPAKGIDAAFDDPNLYVALYSIEMGRGEEEIEIRLFAEDNVGNATSVPFHNRILPRTNKKITVKLSEQFVRREMDNLIRQNETMLRQVEGNQPKTDQEDDLLKHRFKLVNEVLRIASVEELEKLLDKPRFEKLWSGPFLSLTGTVRSTFGDLVEYKYGDQIFGEAVQYGFRISANRGGESVFAANEGIVAFSSSIGLYERALAIDHGMGLFSIYSHLDNVVVSKGETVTKGQLIGYVGSGGFSEGRELGFEMWVQNVRVDPREWWDERWFYGHVVQKTDDVKRSLGMPVTRELR